MMNALKPFYLLMIICLISACSSDDSELNLSDLKFSVSEIEQTSVKVVWFGSFDGDNLEILYRETDSNLSFIKIPAVRNETILNNLNKATAYEIKFEVSNKSSNTQSSTKYFTTKAVDFDYAKFYSNYSWYNSSFYSSFEFFSHSNRNHVIHADGLSDYNDVKVFLVNEQKTDSLEIASTVVSDSLSFTIPNTYLSQMPREAVKKAWIGIKIKDDYQYLLNQYGWLSAISNPNYNPKNDTNETKLKFKIFNDKPYINRASISTGSTINCLNYTEISFFGEYLGYWNFYYWSPKRADLVIFNSNGDFYNSYPDTFEGYSSTICDNFGVLMYGDWISSDEILNYHQRNVAKVKISNLPLGNYSAKIIFTYDTILESIETNTFNFTKE